MLRHPDPPLTDGVITLRAKTPVDADAIVAACQDPEIPRWTLVPQPYRREHAIDWIASAEQTLGEESSIDWLAVDARDTLLASVGLVVVDLDRDYGEIGYWVAREARGRGVATRSVRLVSEWAQRELGLTLLELVIHADNLPSQAVARAAGFEDTGERRGAPRDGLPVGDYVIHAWRAPSSA